MKLTYKINLTALIVFVLVGAAITTAGLNTIRKVTSSLNRQLMTHEVADIVATIENYCGVLGGNQLESVDSYIRQAQLEVLNELTDYRYGVTGKLFIVTDQGIVIKHDTIPEGQQFNIKNIQKMFPDESGNTIFHYKDEERIFNYKYFSQWDWLLILSVTSEEVFAPQKQFIGQVIFILVLCLGLGLLIFALFIRRVVDPILQLARATTFVSEGRWDAPLPQPVGSDEVAQLTTSFRHMAKNLAETYGNLEKNLQKNELSQAALRESEETIRRAQNFLTDILNNIADPIFVKDAQHHWIMLNDAFCNFTGHSREKLLGKSDYDFFQKEEADLSWEQDNIVLATEEPSEKEEFFTNCDGERHIILTKKSVFHSAEGNKILVGSIKDITERKHMEEELLKNQKLKSISILAGGIAHDFNNILTAIIGNLSLLKELVDQEDQIYDRLVETEKASLQAKNLTHQLLTFSQGGAPVKATVSLVKLIEDSITFSLRGTKVRSDMSIEEDIWPVEVDESQMSRVIHNIVINAVQAMPDGGILTVKISNLTSEGIATLSMDPGRYVCVSIADSGTGIPEKLLPNIFDPYFTTKDDGSGLGLAIAYSVIQRHDAHMAVESEVGVGSTFNIYLPASYKDALLPAQEKISLTSGGGDILIMDDEEIVRETVSAMLKHLGYHVECAVDGEEAISMYQLRLEKNRPYDVVIMDLTIPGGMGGEEAIKALLEIDPDARALVSSGYSHDPIMADFKHYGFSGVIAKPFQLQRIAVTLEKVLKNQQV